MLQDKDIEDWTEDDWDEFWNIVNQHCVENTGKFFCELLDENLEEE